MKDEEQDVEFIENDEDGSEKGIQAKVKKLRDKIASLEKEKQEYLDGWQRARADYANLQKNHEDDRKRFKSIFKESFIEEFIPVVDSFLMAMNNKEAWEKVDPNWRTGVEYIYTQLMNVLESHGLKVFGEIGDTFDPAKYEAVSEEETDEASKDHKVSKVMQKGFTIEGNVLRPARVTVYSVKK
jgi:molecular chaperone GrpE